MKRTIIALFSIIFLILSCENPTGERTNPYDPDYGDDQPRGEIVGTVIIDQEEKQAGIMVELRRTEDVPSQSLEIEHRNSVPAEPDWNKSIIPVTGGDTLTDDEGKFVFQNVPPGSYVIRVSFTNAENVEYNSAWVTNLVVAGDGSKVTITENIVLTERLDGKIMFVSSRDGFPEFYQMNLDGTQQERLTFEGINGVSDDDAPISSLDYNESAQLAAFIFESALYIFDRKTNAFSEPAITSAIFPRDIAWGPNNSLYYSDSEGVWKISDHTASSITPTQVYAAKNSAGVHSLDVNKAGAIAFVVRVYLYELQDGRLFISTEGEFPTFGTPLLIDLDGNQLLYNFDLFEDVPTFIPVDQIITIADENNPREVVVTTAHGVLSSPYDFGQGITDSWLDWETGEEAVEVLDDDGVYSYYAYNWLELLQNYERRNTIWGVEWSEDGKSIVYSDLWGSIMALKYRRLIPEDGMTFDFNDPSTYTTDFGSNVREWSYFFNVNRLTLNQGFVDKYLGDLVQPTYAYDSLDNYGVAQSTWTKDGKKILFVKGLVNLFQYSRLDDLSSWTDLDIWIMDSDNSTGEGPQKQLTFNPNKDFLPVWVSKQAP